MIIQLVALDSLNKVLTVSMSHIILSVLLTEQNWHSRTGNVLLKLTSVNNFQVTDRPLSVTNIAEVAKF